MWPPPSLPKDGHGVHAGLLRTEGMPHADALVHRLHLARLQTPQQILRWPMATGLNHRYALFQDHLDVEVVVNGPQRRKEA